MTIKQATQKVIDLAVKQIGYKEPNGDNHNKYAKEIDTRWKGWFNGSKDGYDWCSVFVNWLFLASFDETIASKMLNHSSQYGKMSAVVQYLYRSLMEVNRVGKEPHVGDIIFYHNDKYEGLSQLSHVGIVWKVEGDYVTTIEGNSGKNNTEVATRKIKKNYDTKAWGIYGYGYPNYAAAKDVPDKYPDLPFDITVLKSGVTGMRATGYSDGKYLGTVKAGTYTVTELNNDYGYIGKGWVYLIDKNIVIGKADKYIVGNDYTIRVDNLQLRKDAGTKAKALGTMATGASVTCTGTKKDASGNTWMKVEGWIAAEYNGDTYVD